MTTRRLLEPSMADLSVAPDLPWRGRGERQSNTIFSSVAMGYCRQRTDGPCQRLEVNVVLNDGVTLELSVTDRHWGRMGFNLRAGLLTARRRLPDVWIEQIMARAIRPYPDIDSRQALYVLQAAADALRPNDDR